eukprot:scaffold237583_cov19-Tisochrysis_lutea.AAC.1
MVAMLAQIAVVTKSAEHELNVRYPALVCFGERPSRCQQIHKHMVFVVLVTALPWFGLGANLRSAMCAYTAPIEWVLKPCIFAISAPSFVCCLLYWKLFLGLKSEHGFPEVLFKA